MAKSRFELALQETENQRQILNAHNISEQVSGAALTDSLPNAVSKTMQLTNADKEDVYVPDSYFAQLEIDFENDPLRTKNGGTYPYCSYYVIAADFATSYLAVSASSLLVFSDDTTFTGATTYTKVWDSSKDLIDGTGRQCRLVKKYDLTQATSVCPCYETNTATAGLSPLKFMIWQSGTTFYNTNVTSASVYSLNSCWKLEYCIIDASVIYSGSYFNFYDCSSLRCIKGGTLVINKGQNYHFARDCPSLKYSYIKFSLSSSNQATYLYHSCPNVVEIDLGDSLIINTELSYAYYSVLGQGSMLKNVIFSPNLIEISSRISRPNVAMKTFTIPSSCTTIIASAFGYLYVLEQLTVYQNFNISGLNLTDCNALSRNSLLQIISNLKDRTGDTAGTISFGIANLGKLTAAEIAVATNKNWTLS